MLCIIWPDGQILSTQYNNRLYSKIPYYTVHSLYLIKYFHTSEFSIQTVTAVLYMIFT